ERRARRRHLRRALQGRPRRRQPRPRRARHGSRGALRHLGARRGPRGCRHRRSGRGPRTGEGRRQGMSSSPLTDFKGRPRVAVTGMGVKTPAGQDLDTFWTRIREGRSTAGPIQAFDAAEQPVRFACEVHDFDPEAYFGPKEVRRQDRVAHLGMGAAIDAIEDAGELSADPDRCEVIAATGIGGLSTLEENVKNYMEKGPSRVSPFFVPMMMPNATAGVISMRLGWTGPALCISTACAAGTNAIGEGARLIRDRTSDVVIAGGAEFPITPITVAAFARMGALSNRND